MRQALVSRNSASHGRFSALRHNSAVMNGGCHALPCRRSCCRRLWVAWRSGRCRRHQRRVNGAVYIHACRYTSSLAHVPNKLEAGNLQVDGGKIMRRTGLGPSQRCNCTFLTSGATCIKHHRREGVPSKTYKHKDVPGNHQGVRSIRARRGHPEPSTLTLALVASRAPLAREQDIPMANQPWPLRDAAPIQCRRRGAG